MNTSRLRLVEGLLLLAVVLGVAGWLLYRAFRSVPTPPPAEPLPPVPLSALSSPVLDQLAETIKSERSYGVPILQPPADQVGKSPLL